MKKSIFAVLISVSTLAGLSACDKSKDGNGRDGTFGSQSSKSVQNLSFFQSINGKYDYAIVAYIDDNGTTIKSVDSVIMKPANSGQSDVTAISEKGKLDDAAIEKLKLAFGTQIKDADMQKIKNKAVYVLVGAPQIPAGHTSFEFSTTLSDGSKGSVTTAVDLNQTVFN